MAAGHKKSGELLATHISVEWKFFLEKEFGTFSSPGFEYLGAKWCIDLYMEHGFFELYIYKTHEAALSWGDWAYYIIGIKDINGAIYKCESGKKKVGAADGFGRTKQFLRPCDLRRDKTRIAPQGVLVVFCDLTHKETHWMRMMKNAAVPTEITHQRDASTEVILEYLHRAEVSGEEAKLLDAQGTYKLSGDLQNLLLTGTNFDTIIKISGREFRVHRCILGARSPVFEAMFAHDSVEHSTGTVEIQDCDPDTFEDFLCFLYSGKVKLSSENVVSLYALADKYDVQDVKVNCVNFMVDNLCVDNFCAFITLALKHNEQKMLKSATDFFAKNTKKIILSAKWHCFFTQYPMETNELFIKAIEHNGQGRN